MMSPQTQRRIVLVVAIVVGAAMVLSLLAIPGGGT
jgi:thiamine transporter ThiT